MRLLPHTKAPMSYGEVEHSHLLLPAQRRRRSLPVPKGKLELSGRTSRLTYSWSSGFMI